MKKIYCTGFSLIEIIVYMGILSLITIYVNLTFLTLTNTLFESERETQIEIAGSYLLDQIYSELAAENPLTIPDTYDGYTLHEKQIQTVSHSAQYTETIIQFSIEDHIFTVTYFKNV
jgi:hypothetical protein